MFRRNQRSLTFKPVFAKALAICLFGLMTLNGNILASAQQLQADPASGTNNNFKDMQLEMPYKLPDSNELKNNTPVKDTKPLSSQQKQTDKKEPPKAATPKKPPASQLLQGGIQEKHGTELRIERVQFYYKADEEIHYLSLKKNWLKTHPAQLSLTQAGSLAEEAYNKATIDTPLEFWRYQGGPAPFLLSAKAHIFNDSPEAHLNKKFRVLVKAKIGSLGVNPNTLLVDFNHLNNSGRWKTLSNQIIEVPAIAPGEELLLDVMQLNMIAFMATYPNQWPTEMTVDVSMPGSFAQAAQTIELTPDHFMVDGLVP